MDSLSPGEMDVLLRIVKEPHADHSASSLGKAVGLSSMGALKILKRLEKKSILRSRTVGRSVLYAPNLDEEYPTRLFSFLLCKEAEESHPKVKRWVRETRKLSGAAEAAILFGSVLKGGEYNDIDILLVIKPSRNALTDALIEEMDKVNVKKMHVIRQTEKDLARNIRTGDKVVMGALRDGIAVFGYEKLIGAIRNGTC